MSLTTPTVASLPALSTRASRSLSPAAQRATRIALSALLCATLATAAQAEGPIASPAALAYAQAQQEQQTLATTSATTMTLSMRLERAEAQRDALHALYTRTLRLSAVHALRTRHTTHVRHTTHTAVYRAYTATGALARSGSLCGSSYRFPAVISQWTSPVSCYASIYFPNPAAYASRPGWGWCSWWAEVTHPQFSGYSALHLVDHAQPAIGAVVWFAPGVQGAGGAGHYAVLEAIGPNGWLLISEMNFAWRGGGFGRVDYRYIHEGPGVLFRY